MNVLVSACLLGTRCRYDGQSRPCREVIDLREGWRTRCRFLPVCPEVLGGLTIPHPASEVDTASPVLRVVDAEGTDRTPAFEQGAQSVLEKAQKAGCHLAILKAKSPSCGSTAIYDGTFSGKLVTGSGATARLLRANGIRVIDEVRFSTCDPAALLATSAAETPAIETERLVLRALTHDDAADVFSYACDPAVGPNAGWEAHRSRADSLRFIDDIAGAPHVFGIVERESGQVVGSIGLIGDAFRQRNVDCLMLGYALGRSRWGRGYMTEAARAVVRYGFRDLGLDMVTANCYPDNDRSRRVLEKCEFIWEGTLRGVEVAPDGVMRDCRSYSMMREEYLAES